LIYVTPSHQYPLGATMSLKRRLELLDFARGSGAWIVEDDYDGEFRYSGRPLQALQGLDGLDRVVYLGTFSKTMFPSLRLAYVVAPPDLVGPLCAARYVVDGHSPTLLQSALAAFIAGGHLASHVRRMRSLYAERQAVLLEEVRRHLAGRLEVSEEAAGLHVVGWLADGRDDRRAAAAAAAAGVDVRPVSAYALRRTKRAGLVLGYAALDPPRIRDGVRRLARALA
jgi:GntR family transcriptional regulator / MocR family aminotransferase